MIVYLPSQGNSLTPVSISKDGEFYGQSLGGPVVPRLTTPVSPNNTFDANLSNISSWFFKPVTDYDYINGSVLYRGLYIGSNDKINEDEIIGNITPIVTNNSNLAIIDNTFQVSVWIEGKYNFPKGITYNSGIVLDNEFDTTGKLNGVTWSNSTNYSEVLHSGDYIKVWLKIVIKKDISLLNYDNFNYVLNISGLTFTIPREQGRLNISRVYSVNLDNKTNEYIVKETIPYDYSQYNIVKVIKKDDITYLFYFNTDNKLHVSAILTNLDINLNKYIDIDLSPLTENISSGNFTYESNLSDCATPGTTGTGTSGTSGVGTSGTSGINDAYIGWKFLLDIFATNKESNDFYLFFNQFALKTDDTYIKEYGHSYYNWIPGVIRIDLNHINTYEFANIESGLNNQRSYTISDLNLVYLLDDSTYYSSVILIDDWFIATGFDVEDCRISNNISKLFYVWEKDILQGNVITQKTVIPMADSNFIRTIKNKAIGQAYLMFNTPSEVNYSNINYNRQLLTLQNNKQYVNLASQTRRKVDFGYSSITYDIPLQMDEYSISYAYGFNSQSVTSNTPATSAILTNTLPISGYDITDNPYIIHLKNQNDHDTALTQATSGYFINRYYIKENIPLFKIHCNGNSAIVLTEVYYNSSTKTWEIITKDYNGDDNINYVVGLGTLSVDFDDTLTINLSRKQVYGCGKKYYVNIHIYSNGQLIFSGNSYTTDTTDSYVLTHNFENIFSGYVTYLEVRNSLSEDGYNYAKSLHQIHSNLYWNNLQTESLNLISSPGYEFYTFKRNIILNNLNWNTKDDVVIPIVLQGNAYNIDTSYNQDIRRSIFDFNKIDVNSPVFAFTYEGFGEALLWQAEPYDFDKDLMVVWVRLNNWRGQLLTMYYGDIRLIKDNSINNVWKDYYGAWTMDSFIKEPYVRYAKQAIYNAGEPIVYCKNPNGEFIIEMDKFYMFGNSQLYRSNVIDIGYNDYGVGRNRQDQVEGYIKEQSQRFIPGNMEIRNIKGINADIEVGGT
jgi:hypothetical protein